VHDQAKAGSHALGVTIGEGVERLSQKATSFWRQQKRQVKAGCTVWS
jgi:hypothetical protein